MAPSEVVGRRSVRGVQLPPPSTLPHTPPEALAAKYAFGLLRESASAATRPVKPSPATGAGPSGFQAGAAAAAADDAMAAKTTRASAAVGRSATVTAHLHRPLHRLQASARRRSAPR